MDPFVYSASPMRVVFGRGTLARLADEVRTLKRSQALVLSTPAQREEAEGVAARLGPLAVGVFAEAAMHTPVDVTARAVEVVHALGADCTVEPTAVVTRSVIWDRCRIGANTIVDQSIIADDARVDADLVIRETVYIASQRTDRRLLGRLASFCRPAARGSREPADLLAHGRPLRA